jgi:hypothetical protein
MNRRLASVNWRFSSCYSLRIMLHWRQSKPLSPLTLRTWVRFSFRTQDIHVKRVSQRSTESRWFSPGTPVSSHWKCPQGGFELSQTHPSTVAVFHDQTRVIRWLPDAPLALRPVNTCDFFFWFIWTSRWVMNVLNVCTHWCTLTSDPHLYIHNPSTRSHPSEEASHT